MTLPVSVVIPHKKSRDEFFERFSLPSIRANGPAEIVIEEEGTSAQARNRGARRVSQKYLFHADDDIVYSSNCFRSMISALEYHPDCSFAYSSYFWITLPGVKGYPYDPVLLHEAIPFDPELLRKANYIDMSSMILKEDWIGLDEDPVIEQQNDWDLWLRMAKLGKKGVLIPDVLYHVYNMESGLTATRSMSDCLAAMARKHHLEIGA